MPAHIVNAYYHPSLNEIVVPAGILQPPLFDAEADDAVNFGGIGMVIAHEITHGFDDQGRRFDADGALREWWTAEDAERFNALAERLVDAVRRLHRARRRRRQRPPDARREHRRPRRHGARAARPRARRRRRAGDRRPHARAALLPGQRDARGARTSAPTCSARSPGSIRTARGSCACSARSRTWTRSGTPTGSPTTPRSCGRPRIASRSGDARVRPARNSGHGPR